MNEINKCTICKGPADIDNDHLIDGDLVCEKCWPEYADDNGLCQSCGSELPPIYENNGFTPPEGPAHYDISGYKPCVECRDDSNDRDDED